MTKCSWCHKRIFPLIHLALVNSKTGDKLHYDCFGDRENAFIQALKVGSMEELKRILEYGKEKGK
jgi:hypothetical protein